MSITLSHEFNYKCCCDSGCCWDKCSLSEPPKECLDEIAMAQWIFNESLGYYQAFVIDTGDILALTVIFLLFIKVNFEWLGIVLTMKFCFPKFFSQLFLTCSS